MEKSFNASSEDIINLFRNNTVFKLTSADKIENEYRTEGSFELEFTGRGRVFGKFIKVSDNKIILNWNVEGFNMPPETGTIAAFTLNEENGKCILKLEHTNILHKESANAKKEGWTEILDDMERELSSSKQ